MDSGQRNSRRPGSQSSTAIRRCTDSEGKNHQARHSEPLSDAKVAMRSKTTKGHTHIQIVAESELKDASESFHKEQKGWTEETK